MSFGFGLGFPRTLPFAGGPSLNFQFAGATTLDPLITFTRASSATYFDSAGVLQSAAINAPRLDYNPATLAARGLLIEEQRTNSIRNNTMQGAVAGTPGTLPTNWFTFTVLTGLTSQVVGTGTENGITYIDFRLSGTPSSAGTYLFGPEQSTAVAASNGQNWTTSSYVKLASGSLTGVSFELVVTERSAGGELARSSQAFTPTSATLSSQRITVTRTNNNASTAFELPFVQFNLTGAAIDITLRIGLPQLEQGAFATSVIPTTTTALTRNADVASVNTLTPWFNSVQGTIFAEFLRSTTPAASTFPQFVNIDDGTINNRLALFTNSSRSLSAQVAIGGVFTSLTTGQTWTEGTTAKLALAYQALNHAASANGSSPVSNTAVNVPSGLTALRLGEQASSGAAMNGWLRRITYYPRRLSNAELQSITA